MGRVFERVRSLRPFQYVTTSRRPRGYFRSDTGGGSRKQIYLAMKRVLVIIAALAAAVAVEATIFERDDNAESWRAFCEEYGYNEDTTDEEVINYYLDAWCGSVEEEEALER